VLIRNITTNSGGTDSQATALVHCNYVIRLTGNSLAMLRGQALPEICASWVGKDSSLSRRARLGAGERVDRCLGCGIAQIFCSPSATTANAGANSFGLAPEVQIHLVNDSLSSARYLYGNEKYICRS